MAAKRATSLRLDEELLNRVKAKVEQQKQAYPHRRTTMEGAVEEGLELWLANIDKQPDAEVVVD